MERRALIKLGLSHLAVACSSPQVTSLADDAGPVDRPAATVAR